MGKDFVILATMGHIRDLPKKELGVDLEKDFKPKYVLVVKKKETINKLKEAAKKADKIYLATDPDREGEAIAWHTAQILGRQQPKTKDPRPITNVSRISFHEITKSAIEEALAKPGQINMPLVNAQQARRVLDRLVGYKLSPLLWRKVRRGLSAGRVQSVAVRLIVEREREIEAFKPSEYWEVFCELKKGEVYFGKLVKIEGKKVEVGNTLQANEIVDDLKQAEYGVSAVDKKEVFQRASPPFTTSTLQQKASQVFHFSAKKTMQVAQGLYEKGLITYHRTDSLNLSAQAVAKIRDYISQKYGQSYLPPKPNFYKTKSKSAQEAHEAIRPTGEGQELKDEEIKVLSYDEKKLYEMIFKRAIACQMNPAVFDETKIYTEAKKEAKIYLLRTEGRVKKFDGWLKIYDGKVSEEAALPKLAVGDRPELLSVRPEQKFTTPPARYTEAMLIRTLEEKGIGRPSTYAPTITTIQLRQYVEKLEGRFQPTGLGTAVNDFLLKYFGEVLDYDFTAQMEAELDDIANGARKWVPVIKDFYTPFAKTLDKVGETAKREAVPVEKTGKKCPLCKEGDQIIRLGRFGKFLACSKFPECKYTEAFNQKVGDLKCPDCGKAVIYKKTKKGKRFYGCSGWPKCKWASWRKPK